MLTLTVVATVQAVAIAATVLGFLRHIRALDRQHERRESLRINQVLHATGHPWEEAPADTHEPDEREERPKFRVSPEQHV